MPRSFTIVEAPQRSPEWFQARCGMLTSSRAADMLATIKSGGEAAGRRNLRAQLVLERLTNRPQENGFQSAAMLQGIEREADAYGQYEALTGTLLSRSGFLVHETLMAGASLDGHVGDFEGLAEIKCPLAATHLESLKTNTVPGDYLKQIQHALWLTGANWCDWLSFNPDFPPSLRIKLVRVVRDDKAVASYDLCVKLFLAEVDKEVEAALALGEPAYV